MRGSGSNKFCLAVLPRRAHSRVNQAVIHEIRGPKIQSVSVVFVRLNLANLSISASAPVPHLKHHLSSR
jgi:hypothetical protein